MQQAFFIIHSHEIGDLGKVRGDDNENMRKTVENQSSWCGRRRFAKLKLLVFHANLS
jgi:hypothetical protein